MLPLPAAIRQYANLLSLFPTDLQFEIGKLLIRLSRLITPLQEHPFVGKVEPDGYSGIINRGLYEHLLPSEWALADLVPEEFDRRAAMYEQLYYKPKKQEPKEGLQVVLLLDTGPWQVGKPRIIQLALIILHARRAYEAGAEFYWGSIQKPGALYQDISFDSIKRFLASRTIDNVMQSLDAWDEFLDGSEDRADQSHYGFDNKLAMDLWLVTPVADFLQHRKVSRVSLTEVLDAEKSQIRVSVSTRLRDRSILIDLPANDICTRLIRDPFRSPTTLSNLDTQDFVFGGRVLLNKNGQKLFVTTKDNEILSYPIPNSNKGSVGRCKKFMIPDYTRPIAIQNFKKRLMSISYSDEQHRFYFNNIPWIKQESAPVPEEMTIYSDARLRPLFYEINSYNAQGIFFVDDADKLFKVDETDEGVRFDKICDPVMGIHMHGSDLQFISVDDDLDLCVQYLTMDCDGDFYISETVNLDEKAFLGHYSSYSYGVVAFHNDEQWVVGEEYDYDLIDAGDCTVIGCYYGSLAAERDDDDEKVNAVVVISDDQSTVGMISHSREFMLPRESSGIVDYCFDPRNDILVYLNGNNLIKIYSFKRKEFVAQIQGGGNE